MFTRLQSVRPVFLAVLVAVSGCESDEAAWREAEQANTISAYETFVGEHPDSPFAPQAERRIRELGSADRWAAATAVDTVEAYRGFLAEFPNAENAPEARERVAALERQAEWDALQTSTNLSELRRFATRYAGYPVAEQARERIEAVEAAEQEQAEQEQARREEEARRAAMETHRVQLAALRTEDQAEEGARVLEEKYADVLSEAGLEIAPSGSLFLLRTPPMEQDAAGELCLQLKSLGQDCLVVSR